MEKNLSNFKNKALTGYSKVRKTMRAYTDKLMVHKNVSMFAFWETYQTVSAMQQKFYIKHTIVRVMYIPQHPPINPHRVSVRLITDGSGKGDPWQQAHHL